MSNRLGLFAPPEHAVLSLSVQAAASVPNREQRQFEVLVRHLVFRFLHNELLTSDNETRRVITISYVVALPTLLVSMFLYPAYHAFPPAPYPRPFWPQVGDHYFYVMYSFLIMGAATVYEWDLLFPDLLDVFVLSVLPISGRRLFAARVLALAIFLGLVLVGTGILGNLMLPMVAELPHTGRHFLAHFVAILMSGSFAATTFLALQGVLLNTIGERLFRRITPLLQGGSIMLLLMILLLYPTLSRSIQPLFTANVAAVRWFPPFWFLGVYERLLQGPSTSPLFTHLARTGSLALAAMIALVFITYPLAYRRRVRQVIEGGQTQETTHRNASSLRHLLHVVLVRLPAQRSVFHFVSQTILRAQRQRIMLALYGGLALALSLANMLVLHIVGGRIRPALLPYGIRAAVPIMAFWTVIALTSILSAPIDRRGAWIFSVLLGRPGHGHFAGTRLWITAWAVVISGSTASILHLLSPLAMRMPRIFAGQLLVAAGLSLLLTDMRLFSVRTIPFTHLRTSSVSDFPLMIVRYFVLFPVLVSVVVSAEHWIEASLPHLVETALLFAVAHMVFVQANARSIRQSTIETPLEESEEFLQRLGLRDA